jgi:transcriptional regulator
MHPNPAFRGDPAEVNLAFARTRGFGTLCLNGPEGPMISHVPFVLNAAGRRRRCTSSGPTPSRAP